MLNLTGQIYVHILRMCFIEAIISFAFRRRTAFRIPYASFLQADKINKIFVENLSSMIIASYDIRSISFLFNGKPTKRMIHI